MGGWVGGWVDGWVSVGVLRLVQWYPSQANTSTKQKVFKSSSYSPTGARPHAQNFPKLDKLQMDAPVNL